MLDCGRLRCRSEIVYSRSRMYGMAIEEAVSYLVVFGLAVIVSGGLLLIGLWLLGCGDGGGKNGRD